MGRLEDPASWRFPITQKPGVFVKILDNGECEYIIHGAAPMPDNSAHTESEMDFEKPSIEG